MMENQDAAALLASYYFSQHIDERAQAVRHLIEKSLLNKEGFDYSPEEMADAIEEYMDFMDSDLDDLELIPTNEEDEE